MPSDKICKTVHQYNKTPVSEEDMQKLLDIAKDYQKVKNYVYARYGGIGSLSKIYPGYTAQNEMTSSGYREILGMPAVYFYLAVFDALADIKKQWSGTKSRVVKLVNKNEGFTEEEKHYLRFILKVSNAFEAVLNQKPVELPKALQKQYLDFLRNLLKDQPYVALAYVTGILPVKKYGQHSALNMFWEYSMTDQSIFEEYTGFTEGEVKELCRQYDMDFAETGSWYDGYQFRRFKHVYNPRSVVAAMKSRYFSDYWISTETYEALKVYMEMDFDGLRSDIVRMLGGERISVNTHSFQNDMCTFRTRDDVLTLLIHLGYLGYDAEKKETFIPNREIAGEFENAMSVGGWGEVMRILKASDRLLEDTLRLDAESVAAGLDRAHTEVASILTYNDENTLCCAISLAYYSARKDYRMVREMPAGYGFADVVFLPLPMVQKPVLIIELKYGGSADAAIQQIRDRQYPRALEGYAGEILLVGVNYDKDNRNKPHSCVIERFITNE